MKAWDIVAYTFDGDCYCIDCVPAEASAACVCGETDENGYCDNNCHGYGPDPVFASDAEGETCSACGAPIS